MKRGELALCVFGLFAFYTAFPFGPPARMVSYTPPVPEENPVGTLFDLWTPEEADAVRGVVPVFSREDCDMAFLIDHTNGCAS